MVAEDIYRNTIYCHRWWLRQHHGFLDLARLKEIEFQIKPLLLPFRKVQNSFSTTDLPRRGASTAG